MDADSLLALLIELRPKLNLLFADEWAAKGVLRILPPVPRSYVLRLLHADTSLDATFVGPSAAKHECAFACSLH